MACWLEIITVPHEKGHHLRLVMFISRASVFKTNKFNPDLER